MTAVFVQDLRHVGDGCSVVEWLGHRTCDREAALHCWALGSLGVGKSSTSLLAGVKAGRVHLCRVAGNTV